MPIDIARQFDDSVKTVVPLGNGHINDTYLVETSGQPFVLQKINRRVFPQPERIMANLRTLTRHLETAKETENALQIPAVLTTGNGADYVSDDQGDIWRALSYIDHSISLETLGNLDEAGQVGFALGKFHRMSQALPPDTLHDTLPGFHIAPQYFEHYRSVQSTSKIPENPFCAEFIERYQHIVHDLESAKAGGLLTVRTIHGDPKLNNFLFDKDSRRIVSLIDLDTVKPGLIHYDIGDCLRSCCHDLTTDTFNLAICRALLECYLAEMGDFLTEYDYRFLFPAIRLIPFELGLRFYTDYLEGNRYFKVTAADENMHRARSQFRLCESIDKQETAILRLLASDS